MTTTTPAPTTPDPVTPTFLRVLVYCPTETTVAECLEIKAYGTGHERDYLDAIKGWMESLNDPKSHEPRESDPNDTKRFERAFQSAEHLFVIAYGNYRIEVRQLEFEQDPYYSEEYGPDDDDDEINK